MARATNDHRLECFPTFENDQSLTRPIPFTEVNERIELHYQAILKKIAGLFSNTSQAGDLQKNRGRLSSLIAEIRKNIGIPKDGPNTQRLETFGDVRRTKKKVTKTVAEAIKGNEKHKDRRLHTHVAFLVEQAVKEVTDAYVTEIRQDNIPAKAPTTTPRAQPSTVKIEAEKAPEVEHQTPGQETPHWIRELSSDDVNAFIALLSTPTDERQRDVVLNQFFISTASRYANNQTERMKLVRKITHSACNETSYLHLWLRRNGCGAFFGLTFDTPGRTNEAAVHPQKKANATNSAIALPTRNDAHPPRTTNTETAVALTEQTITAAEMEAMKDDPAAMLALIERIDDIAWKGEHVVKARFDDERTYQTWRSIVMHRANYAFAVQAIADMEKGVKITPDKQSGNPQESWRLLFNHVRRSVAEEIERGDTPFGPDELDVAFELHLKELKLWAQFCELRTSSNGNSSTKITEEKHPSTIGFSEDEIKELPKEDREQINRLFAKISPQAKNAQHYKDIGEDDAFVFCEISRLYLIHRDSTVDLFNRRLKLKSSLVWKAIEYRKMHTLSKEEKSALRDIERRVSELETLRESDPEAFEDRAFDMRKYIALYRRLLRVGHTENESERLHAAATAMGAKVTDIKRWERKDFVGLTNNELAPDLFPVPESEAIDTDNHPAPPRHNSRVDEKNTVPHTPVKPTTTVAPVPHDKPVPATTDRTIFQAVIHGTQESFEPMSVSPDDFEPTDALPGSEEKMAVIAKRLAAGHPANHPRDRYTYGPNEGE